MGEHSHIHGVPRDRTGQVFGSDDFGSLDEKHSDLFFYSLSSTIRESHEEVRVRFSLVLSWKSSLCLKERFQKFPDPEPDKVHHLWNM